MPDARQPQEPLSARDRVIYEQPTRTEQMSPPTSSLNIGVILDHTIAQQGAGRIRRQEIEIKRCSNVRKTRRSHTPLCEPPRQQHEGALVLPGKVLSTP